MVCLFRTRCTKAREGKGEAEQFGCGVDKALVCKDELWHKTFPFLCSVWKGGLFLLPLVHHKSFVFYALGYAVLDLWEVAEVPPYTLNYCCEFTNKLTSSEACSTPTHGEIPVFLKYQLSVLSAR